MPLWKQGFFRNLGYSQRIVEPFTFPQLWGLGIFATYIHKLVRESNVHLFTAIRSPEVGFHVKSGVPQAATSQIFAHLGSTKR